MGILAEMVRDRTRARPISRARRLLSERLEGRQLLAADLAISISDARIEEVSNTSAFVAPASGGLETPLGLTVGPDGKLYVASSAGSDRILRYDAATGQFLDTFVSQGSGGLQRPHGLTFGPDGHLYVASQLTDSVLRYDGASGAFIDEFVAAGSGGLDGPKGIQFGQDGNLYVSSRNSDAVLRFEGPLGQFPGSPFPATGKTGATFVDAASGGLDAPHELVFGPDGHLYVSSTLAKDAVLRFDGRMGSFLDEFVPSGRGGLGSPRGLAFDQDGRLFVASTSTNELLRFDGTGTFIDAAVLGGSSRLNHPIGIAFDPQGALLICSRDSDSVERFDRGVLVSLSQAASETITVNYSTADGTATAGTDYTAQAGTITFAPGQTSRRILLVARDDVAGENDESFAVNLTSVTGGATIADDVSVVAIADDEALRQIAISDATGTEGDDTPHYRGAFVNGSADAHFNPLTFGPDGNVYTAVGTGPGYNTVQRFDGKTGAFLNTFIDNSHPDHKIDGVRDILFHPTDGYVYVASAYTDEVLRYDAQTGSFVDVFVSANSGGVDHPDGMQFGPDSNGDGVPELYVTGWLSHSVNRYDGATGMSLGTYVGSGSGGLSYPFSLAFHSGELFVTSAGTDQILKYAADTGAYLGIAASTGLDYPRGLTFGPDGLLYVTSGNNDRVVRFTVEGTYVDDYVPAGAAGLDDPRTPRFGPDGNLYLTVTGKNEIMRFGTENEVVFTVSVSEASSLPIDVSFATVDGSAVAGSDYGASSGTVTLPPGTLSKTVLIPLLDDVQQEGTETFSVSLTGATGGVIVDGEGIASILDDEIPPTKFYVVNDASADRTYEYDSAGASVENYVLGSDNTQPRGAASTAAGTQVWVADRNRNVYVYDTSGTLQGSWTAGSLSSKAQVEGLATDGSDVWIVDNYANRVYRYSGAAGRLGGSQNASSSFALNSGNRNPKGVVTDGTYLWVLQDASTDKVYKYRTSGSLVGSWGIDSANSTPTGLTLDPSGATQHLWIVDSGSDRVYQYDDARSRTSGSQAASSKFLLATGNTNPQGIADPPVRGAGAWAPTAPVSVARKAADIVLAGFEAAPSTAALLRRLRESERPRQDFLDAQQAVRKAPELSQQIDGVSAAIDLLLGRPRAVELRADEAADELLASWDEGWFDAWQVPLKY